MDNYITQPDLDPDSFFQVTTSVNNWLSAVSERSFRKEKRLEKMFTELFLHLVSSILLSVIYIGFSHSEKSPKI